MFLYNIQQKASSGVRTKYDQIAKKKKQGYQVTEEKFTSTGIPLSVVERQQRQKKQEAEAEERDIKNMIKLKAFNNKGENFFHVLFSFLCGNRIRIQSVTTSISVLHTRYCPISCYKSFYTVKANSQKPAIADLL